MLGPFGEPLGINHPRFNEGLSDAYDLLAVNGVPVIGLIELAIVAVYNHFRVLFTFPQRNRKHRY